MAKLPRVPRYGLHKATGQARVLIGGKHFYLGKYRSPESLEKYHRLVAEHIAPAKGNGDGGPALDRAVDLTVSELILAYWTFARAHYVKDGKPTDEQYGLRAALRFLRKLYGGSEAREFGPRALQVVRQVMIDERLSRKYINDNVNRIRRVFKWAVSEELLPVSIYQSLQTVPGLKAGRSAAKETQPVMPVPQEVVRATLPHVLPAVAAMIQVQDLTGMRPQEIRNLRASDIDTAGDVWVYTPRNHKTEHFGITRRIAIGPRAQRIIRPFLKPDAPEAFVFCPKEAIEAMRCARRVGSEDQPRAARRKRRAKAPARHQPGPQYGKRSYEVAIGRACKKAGVPHGTPNQLRHSCATRVRQEFGAEGAAAVLGNSLGMVVEVYAESNFNLAIKIMREMG